MARTVSKSAGKPASPKTSSKTAADTASKTGKAKTGKAKADAPTKTKASATKAVAPKKAGRSSGKRFPAGVIIARQAVSAVVDQVAADIRAGETPHTIPDLGLRLISLPHSVEFLFELLVTEGQATPRDDDRCSALLLILGAALGQLRMAMESQVGGAAEIAMALLGNLLTAAEEGDLPPDLIFGLAQQFTAARLPIPDEVRDLIVSATREPMEGRPIPGPDEMATRFAEAAESLDHDPFLIHEQLAEQFAILPNEARIVAVGVMAEATVPAIREAALGWLLDPNPDVARAVAERLAAAAERGLVSAETAQRLIWMRPWLPGPVEAAVGSAIAACRARGIVLPPVEAAAPARSVRFVASGIDGSGAQSVFAMIDEMGRHSLVALLMKHGHGLRETVLQEDIAPAESALFLQAMAQGMDCFAASPGFVQELIAHGLATGLASGEPPPFELLRFLDLSGLPAVAPARLAPAAIVAQLLEGLPEERRSQAATAAALAASKTWPKTYRFPDGWFEADEASAELVQSLSGAKVRDAAVLEQIIAPRRAQWGEKLAWIAKAAQGGRAALGRAPARNGRKAAAAASSADETWIDLALVARAFLDETPIAEIPLAAWIAQRTVVVHRGR